jgi:threonylcarbamoyladenosine tRNA methylthiotransferase MtaB
VVGLNGNMVKAITLGCRFNFCETEMMKRIVESFSCKKNVVIINTCAVTNEAARKSKQAIRKIIRENSDAIIIVTGCALKTDREEMQKIKDVCKFISNEDKYKTEAYSFLLANSSEKKTELGLAPDPTLLPYERPDDVHIFEHRSRVFLQIQNGCDHFCSYCVVPFTRGRSKSCPLNEIVEKVNYFVNDRGFKEVVLSGIDITSYGKDLDRKIELTDILEQIVIQVPQLKRLRLSSLDPAGISSRLLNFISTEKIVLPHFHLSIQSGDNDVLKAMKRRHSREDVIDLCYNIKSKKEDVLFGADFIVGFPTETEEMFQNTAALIREINIAFCHIFPYSSRKGTVAASLIQLSRAVVTQRAKELAQIAICEKIKAFERFVGKEMRVFIEKTANNESIGKTDNFIPVLLTKTYGAANIVKKSIDKYKDGFLIVYDR